MTETRQRIAHIRAADVGGQPGVTLHCIRPGVVDDYGSVWQADAFDASLAERMPTLCWTHDWAEPLGPPVAFRTTPDGPEVDFVFSDFEAVPMARRAHAQVQDGTIEDCSVGFSAVRRRDPTDAEKAQYHGIREVIEQATLDEVSLVLRGAVPGAKVLSVRSSAGTSVTVPEDDVVAIARRVNAGDLSFEDGRTAVALLADGTEASVDRGDSAHTARMQHEVAQLDARMTDMFSNDQGRLLSDALDDRFQPGPDRYVWVCDFTDDRVVFEKYGFDDAGLFQLAYTITDGAVALEPGDPVEVQRVTSYVPEPGNDDTGTASAAEAEQRAAPDDLDPVELAALASRAYERSR